MPAACGRPLINLAAGGGASGEGFRVISLADAIARAEAATPVREETSFQLQASAGSGWRIVWCHERCHKEECAGLRMALEEVVQQVGGTLLCFKKAKQYSKLLARVQRRPFVLLTDWREAKPCMSATLQQGAGNRPLLTIVHCDQAKPLERVTAWVQNLPWQGVADRVAVITDSGMPEALMSEIAKHVPGILNCSSAASSCGSELQPTQDFTAQHHALLAAEPDHPPPNQKRVFVHDAGMTADSQRSFERTSAAPPFLALKAGLLAQPVRQMLSSICSSHNSVELTRMLANALPEQYDD